MATPQLISDSTALALAETKDRQAGVRLAVRTSCYSVFKHSRLVLGVFLTVFVASIAVAIFRPSHWLVSTKVLVKLGETLQLAPSEAPSRSINLPLSQEVVKTEADIVKSYVVVDEAMKRLGIQPEEGTSWAEFIDAIQQGLTVTPNPGQNDIQINFIGKDPKRAARLVNMVTDVYIEHHNAVYGKNGVKRFYDRQLKKLEKQMKRSQERLRAFLAKNNMVDIDQESHLLQADILEQDKALKAHRAKIAGTQHKLKEVENEISSTPEQIAFSEEYLSNPTVLAFKAKLADLEVQRIQLLELYVPTDRRVTDVEEQIGNLKDKLKGEELRILNKKTLRHNDLYAELQRNKLSLQTLLADANAREPSMVDRLDVSRERLSDLRNKRYAVDNLKQEADQKQYSYDLYWKKQEEARITEAMSDRSMVDVSIVDRATPPITPLNPWWLPPILGLVGGLALGAVTAIAVEYLSRRLRFEEEVEKYLELPVLAVIPDLQTVPAVVES